MSGTFDALQWVRRVQVAANEKALLYALASYVDENDECYPSQATLAGDAGMGERTVRRLLADFEARGIITRTSRLAPEGRGRTSDRIRLHVGWKAADQPANLAGLDPADQPANLDDQPAKSDRPTGQIVHDQPATGGRGTTSELPVELPEEQPTRGDAFDAFWTSYPRKVAKPAARTAFARALKRANAGTIMAGLERHRPSMEARVAAGEPQYVCHPVTWLNQDRWDDEPPPMPNGRRPSGPPANGGVRQVKPRDAWEDPDIMEDPFA